MYYYLELEEDQRKIIDLMVQGYSFEDISKDLSIPMVILHKLSIEPEFMRGLTEKTALKSEENHRRILAKIPDAINQLIKIMESNDSTTSAKLMASSKLLDCGIRIDDYVSQQKLNELNLPFGNIRNDKHMSELFTALGEALINMENQDDNGQD